MKASVIIPSYNACERLYYNLLSLNSQSCDKEMFEVIVIDNGSSDQTHEMLKQFNPSFCLKWLRLKKNLNRSKARNIGINNACGEIIIFSDSDMISEMQFVEKHINAHDKPKVVVSGSNWEKIYTYYYKDFKGSEEKSLLKQLESYKADKDVKTLKDKDCLVNEQSIIDGSYKALSFTNFIYENSCNLILKRYGNDLNGFNFHWSFFITNNCSVSKENIIKAGMFDENYEGWGCEDLDLGYRLYKGGCSCSKLDIESIHQEHPGRRAEDGMRNIYYFSEKYEDADVLLFYFHDLIPIDFIGANEIINEINSLKTVPKFMILIDTFAALLKTIRDSYYSSRIEKMEYRNRLKQTRQLVYMNKEKLIGLCQESKEVYGCTNLAEAFLLLLKRITKVHPYYGAAAKP